MKFSEKVRKLRIRSGLSQEELSEKLDVSRQTISKWEAGNSFPEIEKLISMSDFFQVSIDYLLRDNIINTNFSEDLDRMVIQFLGSSYEMADISRQLVDIMADGIIDDKERIQMEDIICTLDKISENIEKIRKAIDITYSCNSESIFK
ncbi:MAG: helix-turn-helix domain-containing protein [Oscillospiraceae bacterium]|nr:helix-turn-helix domain-containing protein [Oscillospiraceae bacterium]